MERRGTDKQGTELDDAGNRMRTASVLKEDKEWEKARAAERIMENFKTSKQSKTAKPQSVVILCSLSYTTPHLHCTVHHLLPL